MARQPRVVILVENLPVPLDRRVWLEARTLRDAGWQVVVISPQGGPGMRRLRQRIAGIEVLRYPQREASGMAGYLAEYLPSMLFSLVWLLWARINGPVDVIHGCNPPDLFWLLGRVGRSWGARYVFDQHDPNPELSLTKFGSTGARGRLMHRLTLAMENASYRTADAVLAVNESCRDIAIDRGRLDPARVSLVRNAPEVATIRQLAAGIEPDGRRVGYLGVMGTQDGLDILLDAWRFVVDEPDMADARLELVGDGPARASLERRLEDPRLRSSVRFHGFQPPAAFVPLLARCRFGVSPDPPTPFNHLLTMVKIIDLMAIGRGCVAFDLRETGRLGGDALRLATSPDARGLADAMLALLRDPAEARRLGEAAQARIDELRLDWAPAGRALVEVYGRLAPGDAAPA